jgi:lysophospholipase L1-like esterase
VPDPASRPYARYVALGDSSTEGLEDPDGRGGYRGWANRLAERVAAAQGSLLYANLAVRGRTARRILDEQLAPALALRPDLATLFAGTNDAVRSGFDAAAVRRDVETMLRALVDQGATVLTFTLADPAPLLPRPMARRIAPRVAALNEALREAAAASGARLVDFALWPVASDARLWNEDRLHANADGHARIAAALAERLALPGTDGSWREPLPPLPPPGPAARLRADLAWVRRHFGPWVGRHLRGRSSGDGRVAKRPRLAPVTLES